MRLFTYAFSFAVLLCLLPGCSPTPPSDALFKRLSADRTGIAFANTVTEDDSLNIFNFPYLYNGGGVAVADFNGDSLPDLYFSGNQVESALYLNRGDLRFEAVPQATPRVPHQWTTGVAAVDINQDGWMDLYLCVADAHNRPDRSRNQLWVHQGLDADGRPTFREMADAYGIADEGFSVQGAFFDYDRDGDLDLYVLTNRMEAGSQNVPRMRPNDGSHPSTDRLYRNEGTGPQGHPVFTNVSREAGITQEGYGLGIAVGDINQDGWPDLYVANDFLSNDLLWINNGRVAEGQPQFTNRAATELKHQSMNGMGTDLADLNNDGWSDIVVVDMLPEDNLRQKTMLPSQNYDRFQLQLRYGYEPQYVRNTLQLNRGPQPDGQLAFSEIGQFSGIQHTDWSWAPLLADFDNDGYQDLYITNGYRRDVTDLDFIVYENAQRQFGTGNLKADARQDVADRMAMLPVVKTSNYFYRNQGDLTFADVTKDWGTHVPSFSNGAAYADLDRDGDLDLVVNNLDEEAFVFENTARTGPDRHFLRLACEGPSGNRQGLGLKATLYQPATTQFRELSVNRGFQSTVEPVLHFGLGNDPRVDSVRITWPDGRVQVLRNVPADQTLWVRHREAQASSPASLSDSQPPLFQQVAAVTHRHQESTFNEFKVQPLLPHSNAQTGPALAVGDLNGDGRDDAFVGGAKDQPARLFVQQPDGSFTALAFTADQRAEDQGALFFDADGDGDQDLYVVSGGVEFYAGNAYYQDRLYRNDGRGRLQRDTLALPPLHNNGSCVVAADWDRDGDLDLFVGGRTIPGQYPLPDQSHLLENDGRGHFTDVTATQAPELAHVGVVNDARWTDTDQDGWPDLLLAGEWMPLTLFQNQQGQFRNVTAVVGLQGTSGWWNSLAAGDFDQDGDLDYVAGNLGRNNPYQISADYPLRVYAKDFDGNGSLDPVLTCYLPGPDGTRHEYPVHSRDAIVDQMVRMKGRFHRYRDYAQAEFSQVFSDEERQDAYVGTCEMVTSMFLENRGVDSSGTVQFRLTPLPDAAQLAPIYGMLAGDFNDDGALDLLAVGNSYATETIYGWYDAGIGTLLAGSTEGGFTVVPNRESGFWVDTDAKAMAELRNPDGQRMIWVTSNQDSLRTFALHTPHPLPLALQPLDAYAEVRLADGRLTRVEFTYGNTYLSQSSRTWEWPRGAQSVTLVDSRGNRRTWKPQFTTQ
ncbi:Repeat domain-containing protein [Catalinimonas alkaloidigena]|uniref:Repeat domain-containing protein n=1 Tax=Catalinimonas alkaloidigena TaxID=1075417 RepID=A0A1G9RH47_9BACT|nr:VCBS repeat-containing protein [Catalinimonas alkaloidigena]SDM22523.1 Repeat domain-containing protein [Catalinimonas alkaloidigena]